MITLAQMEIFYGVATWQSFSRAATALGVSKGYVSTQITALEKALKTRLLQRTTRHLHLTEAGRTFLAFCTRIVQEKQQAIASLDLSEAPRGHLTVTAPPSLCSTRLAELLPTFQKQYPNISFTLESSATIKNLVQHGIDIALRITHTPDESHIARLVAAFTFVICATPSYLKKYGVPKKPADLIAHNCLVYSADPTQNRWPFQMTDTVETVSVNGDLFSDNSTVIKNVLLAHRGITRLPNYVVAPEISRKKLIPLFSENTTLEMPLYAIYVSQTVIPPKIKCFINFLKENLPIT